ncbi:MAG TPA: SDR family oxidoreductase [Steroidobacteraceae bacterium]|nr:SDR family oxidoreductase [Steroidobacteraceae bacterium]
MIPAGFDFSGRVAVVTGGGSGIGAATAMLLGRLGANVAIAGRTVDRLQSKAAEIAEASGRGCIAVPTDVRDEEQVANLIRRVVEHYGRIDVLVNNAGGTFLSPLSDVTSKMWDKSFALNVDAAYYCTREAGRHFIAQGSGAIVNVSSLAGVHGTKGGAPYSSAKAALQMLTRVSAAEWGPYGIRVNCVAPGMILSERVTEHLEKSNIDLRAGMANLPLRRAGKPEEVANAIVFLASDAASYITGETLSVGGGPVLGGPRDL